MKRIRLSKDEKRVLRLIAAGQCTCPAAFPRHVFNAVVRSLDHIGFVHAMYAEGGEVVEVKPTPEARQYLAENPGLRNPVDWRWVVTSAISLLSAAIGVIAMLVACGR